MAARFRKGKNLAGIQVNKIEFDTPQLGFRGILCFVDALFLGNLCSEL